MFLHTYCLIYFPCNFKLGIIIFRYILLRRKLKFKVTWYMLCEERQLSGQYTELHCPYLYISPTHHLSSPPQACTFF